MAISSGRLSTAKDHLEKGLQLNERALQADPGRKSYLGAIVSTHLLLADLHIRSRQWTEAQRSGDAALAAAVRLNNHNDDPSDREWLAVAYTKLGKV